MGDLIDAVVSSVDVCWRKPSDRFYDTALSQAGVPAEDCLMVGNSETLDIAPAKARGMSAIRVAIEEPFPSASGADRVCSSLEEVMSGLAAQPGVDSWEMAKQEKPVIPPAPPPPKAAKTITPQNIREGGRKPTTRTGQQ